MEPGFRAARKERFGEKNTIAKNFPNQIKPYVVKQVLELRQEHKFGTW